MKWKKNPHHLWVCKVPTLPSHWRGVPRVLSRNPTLDPRPHCQQPFPSIAHSRGQTQLKLSGKFIKEKYWLKPLNREEHREELLTATRAHGSRPPPGSPTMCLRYTPPGGPPSPNSLPSWGPHGWPLARTMGAGNARSPRGSHSPSGPHARDLVLPYGGNRTVPQQGMHHWADDGVSRGTTGWPSVVLLITFTFPSKFLFQCHVTLFRITK